MTPSRATLATTAGSIAAAPAALLAATALAWFSLSQADFFYGRLYDLLSIDRHIAEYAPQNRYRDGFAQTSRAERLALFHGMLRAVNNGGSGLRELSYRANGERIPFLRAPEIRHLRDVARLITWLYWAGVVSGLLLAVFLASLVRRRRRPRTVALATSAAACAVLPALLAFAAFDAERGGWFDRVHEMVFPPEHQWFFYYQESLMTTLLKAPDIFGPMGAQWICLSLVLFLLIIVALYRVPNRHER